MNKNFLFRRLAYAFVMTMVVLILQFFHGNMMAWFLYIFFFLTVFIIVCSKFWNDTVIPWSKKNDEKFNKKQK